MPCPHCNAPIAPDARFCGACGRATVGTAPSYQALVTAPSAAPDLVGREIGGRYRVTAKLGEGGMGAVYRGEQISLKRKVAIKVLRPELSADPGLVRRFNAEAELAAKLSHPNTVNIYDFGQDSDGALFIAMELLEGTSLRQVMTQEGAMPPARAVAICQQISRSLADAHRHGIVHRDLKPDNVMLTERGRERDVVRVLDFGIAKLRDDNRVTNMTRAGDLVGTPQYMAPEQIKGEAVDGRTDVYALGAMLYEMLTARLPFEGPTVMAMLSKHLTEMPASPGQRRPELALPPALDALVMAALAKEPVGRPSSMEAFGEQLDGIAAQLTGVWTPGYSAPVPAVGAPSGGGYAPIAGPPSSGGHAPTPPPAMVPSPVPGGHGGHGGPYAPSGYPSGGGQPAGPPPYDPRAAYAPPPMDQGPPSYGGAPSPSPGRSWGPILAIVGVLAAAGGAVGIYFATRGKPDAKVAPAPGPGPKQPAIDDDDPWAKSGSGARPAPLDDDWTSYTSADGVWTIELPPGMPQAPNNGDASQGVFGFRARLSGAIVEVGAIVAAVPGDLTAVPRDQLNTMLVQQFPALAQQMKATVSQTGTVDTDGVSRPFVVMRSPEFGQGEGRLYVSTGHLLFAFYATSGDFDASSAARRHFFEQVELE